MPQITFKYLGSFGFISIFSLMCLICTAIMLSAPYASSFHTFSYIWSIEYTIPLFFVKNFSMLYSVGVSFTSFPSTVIFFRLSSIIKSPELYIFSFSSLVIVPKLSKSPYSRVYSGN